MKNQTFPADNDAALRRVYGPPGESQLVSFTFPFPMHLYERGGQIVTKSRCHAKVKDSLLEVLAEIEFRYGPEWIAHHGLDVYGGIYNYRPMRASTTMSRHSWGIAIDLNPSENAFRTPWRADMIARPGFATMPLEAIEIFEQAGWLSGARAWGRDAMHFQATA